MKLENNFAQVKNDQVIIDKVNAVAAAFGWTVKNVQITYSQYTGSTGTASWTMEFRPAPPPVVPEETVKYADITYQRDMDDPRYPEWVRLEREYNDSLQNNRRLSAQEYRDMEQMEMAAYEKGKEYAAYETYAKYNYVTFILCAGGMFIFGLSGGAFFAGLLGAAAMLVCMLCFLAGLRYLIHMMPNVKWIIGGADLKEKGKQLALEKDEDYQALLQKERSLAQKERDAILARARAL